MGNNKCDCNFCGAVNETFDRKTLLKSSIRLNDQVVFLKADDKFKDKFNFGLAKVIHIENKDRVDKHFCILEQTGVIYCESKSYPFQVVLDKDEVLRNFTEEKRNKKKEEEKI